MDFIIIKVAAFGLNKDYLGKRVKDCFDQFAKMVLCIKIFFSNKNSDFIHVEKVENLNHLL